MLLKTSSNCDNQCDRSAPHDYLGKVVSGPGCFIFITCLDLIYT